MWRIVAQVVAGSLRKEEGCRRMEDLLVEGRVRLVEEIMLDAVAIVLLLVQENKNERWDSLL